jgi:hypothetical protein
MEMVDEENLKDKVYELTMRVSELELKVKLLDRMFGSLLKQYEDGKSEMVVINARKSKVDITNIIGKLVDTIRDSNFKDFLWNKIMARNL